MDVPNERGADEQAIRSVLQQLVDAWDAGDGTAYGAVFEDDADYITFGGSHAYGRSAIAAEHQQLFDTFLRGSRLSITITDVRFLNADIAVAHAVGGILDRPDQSELEPTRASIQSAVLRNTDGHWLISASQVTRIQSVRPGVNVPAHRPVS